MKNSDVENSDVAKKIFDYLLYESSMASVTNESDLKAMGIPANDEELKELIKDPVKFTEYLNFLEEQMQVEISTNTSDFSAWAELERLDNDLNNKITKRLETRKEQDKSHKTKLQSLSNALKPLNKYIEDYNHTNSSSFKIIKLQLITDAIDNETEGFINKENNLPEFSNAKTKLNKENIQRDPYYDGAFIAEYDNQEEAPFLVRGRDPNASKSKILHSKTEGKPIQKDWTPQEKRDNTRVRFNDDSVLRQQAEWIAYSSNLHEPAKVKTPDEKEREELSRRAADLDTDLTLYSRSLSAQKTRELTMERDRLRLKAQELDQKIAAAAPKNVMDNNEKEAIVYKFEPLSVTTSFTPSATSSLGPSDTIDRVTLLEEALMYNSQDKFVSLAKPIPLKKLIAQVKMADDKRVSDLKEMLKEALEDPEYAVSHENLRIISDQINSLSITKDKERAPSSHNIQNNLGSKDFVTPTTSSAELKEDYPPNANTLRMSLKRLEEIDTNALKPLKEKDPTDLEHLSPTSVVIDGKNSFPFFTVEDQNNYNSLLKILSDTIERNKETGDHLSYDKVQKMIKKKGISPRVVIEVTNELLRDRSDDQTIKTLANLRKDAKISLLTPVNLGVTSSPTEAFKTGQTYRKPSSPGRWAIYAITCYLAFVASVKH